MHCSICSKDYRTMAMRGFELLLIVHLVYIQVPSGSTMTTSSGARTTATPAPPPTTTPRPTTTPPPTSPPTTNNSAEEACPAVDVCVNGGICEDGPASGESFMCRCPYGTTGRFCETACVQRKVDLLLIEDASPSVTKTEDYAAMKEFEVQLINDTRINLSLLHVAEVVFGKEAEVGFHLNTFQDKGSALAAIANATKEHGPTFLDKAVKIADINVFSEKNGDRTDADNVVIVFTDGRSRNTMNIIKDAGGLRRKAVIYVVALTKNQAIGTMKDVASKSSLVFTDRQKALKDISDSLTELTCQSERPGRK
ncbi:cartilage matrix protein-like [Haliotis cracherodii]|uniref:cartilage matrix protein-like n=1 Tax=Haliotis cracherodii TaxID=6455 RepID=UPI0039E87317